MFFFIIATLSPRTDSIRYDIADCSNNSLANNSDLEHCSPAFDCSNYPASRCFFSTLTLFIGSRIILGTCVFVSCFNNSKCTG